MQRIWCRNGQILNSFALLGEISKNVKGSSSTQLNAHEKFQQSALLDHSLDSAFIFTTGFCDGQQYMQNAKNQAVK